MKGIAAAARFIAGLVLALRGLCTIVFVFPRLSAPQREARVQDWARRMLGAVGIRLEVQGTLAPGGPMLLVCNHISWLDILVLHAARHCRFVAKADVKRWPLVGTLATGAGTLYIERESRRDAMRVVHHMADRLRAGDVLAIFPEGTTSDGSAVLPFHGNLVQAAISAGAPVQPVALGYFDAASGAPSTACAYVGDDTLLASIWKTLSSPPMVARLAFGGVQSAQGRDRRRWAHELHDAVGQLRDGG